MIRVFVFTIFIFVGAMLQAKTDISVPTSFQAHFEQIITNDQNKSIVYRGEVDFIAPEQFKWSYRYPSKKEVCIDGFALEVVDHDLEQVSSYNIEDDLNLLEILKSARSHRPTVYNTQYRGKTYTIQVNSQKELSRIAYKDNLDNNVLIIFTGMKYRKDRIKKSQMSCTFPDSYDQIGS